MDRLACVDVPALPLQLLLRRHADWAGLPAAVVEQDKPQGRLLWVNEEARRLGVLSGLTYAQGLSFATSLRAAEMPERDIAQGVTEIASTLRLFSPDIEPAPDEPGVFWLNAQGLQRIARSASDWARRIHAALTALGFQATAVIGFRRFGVYAVAKASSGVRVFAKREQEDAAMREVALDRLHLETKTRDTLARLGVRTVGEFLELPPDGLHKRFGKEAKRLRELAAGEAFAPLTPERPRDPLRAICQLEPPESDSTRLLFIIKGMLHPLFTRLAQDGRALSALEMRFVLERAEPRVDHLRPAEPTLNQAILVDLIRLRLEAAPLPAAVGEINLTAEEAPADPKQLRLFFEQSRRDLDAGDRALARLRAELGPDAVLHARLLEGHLPEARFAWEPLDKLQAPHHQERAAGTLVRRFRTQPLVLPPLHRQEPGTWLIRHLMCGPIDKLCGPYIVSGGWWRRETHRQYYFAQTRRGDLLWLYYDLVRRRWFLHGEVE
jgi:protein ImuB